MSLTPVRNKQENAINKSRGGHLEPRGAQAHLQTPRASQCTGRAHAAAPSALDSRMFETLPLTPRCIQNPLPVLRAST